MTFYLQFMLVSDEKVSIHQEKSSLSVALSQKSVHLSLKPSKVLTVRSEMLRNLQNVPAGTKSWPRDPILGLAGCWPALA